MSDLRGRGVTSTYYLLCLSVYCPTLHSSKIRLVGIVNLVGSKNYVPRLNNVEITTSVKTFIGI